MAVSKKKHTLTSSCIKGFLKHALAIGQAKEKVSSKFFKFLIISRSYLATSQHKSVYEFILLGQSHKAKSMFSVTFDNEFSYHWRSDQFDVPMAKFDKFACLLDPRYFHVNTLEFSKDAINKLDTLIEKLKGKISFRVDNDQNKKPMIQKFASRLYQLNCETEFLLEGASVPTLDLDFCKILKPLENIYQVRQILDTHKIKELSLSVFDPLFEKSAEELSPINFNNSVKSLHLDIFKECKFEDLDRFLKMMQEWFPSIKSFEMVVYLKDTKPMVNKFNSSLVAANVSNHYQIYQQLQSNFSSLEYRRLDVQLFVGWPSAKMYDIEWIHLLKNCDEFKDARIEEFEGGNLIFHKFIVEDKGSKFSDKFTVTVVHESKIY